VEDPASWKRERRSRTTTNKPFCNGNQNSNSKRIFTRYSGLSLRAWSIAHFSERRLSASSQPSPETQPPEPIHSVSTIPAPESHTTPALHRSPPALPSLPLRAPMKAIMVCALPHVRSDTSQRLHGSPNAARYVPRTRTQHRLRSSHVDDAGEVRTCKQHGCRASGASTLLPTANIHSLLHFTTLPVCRPPHTSASLRSRLSVVISTVKCALKLCAYYALPR